MSSKLCSARKLTVPAEKIGLQDPVLTGNGAETEKKGSRMPTMVKFDFFPRKHIPERLITFVVIGAFYGEKSIFVRHHTRETWELPGGHREEQESSFDAAVRELKEETGARSFSLYTLGTYRVRIGKEARYGRLYRAEVKNMGPLGPYEIEEVVLRDTIPPHLTYPEIQPHLYQICRNSRK